MRERDATTEQRALSDIDLQVEEGKTHAIIGPNGAGKSTLFNVITGLHTPSAGRIAFQGEPITGLEPEIINRRGLAKTFQITNVFPGLSVFDNVRVAAQSRATVSGRLASLWRRSEVTASARSAPPSKAESTRACAGRRGRGRSASRSRLKTSPVGRTT